ncbi:MAG: PhnD/SsuA/transferrin family substrate-binding protein [Candidatus Riflebacteria bacterium]|nr:PhnD/SsuA/transferrin family substrate-binding protein [Candidatus Riflebacteria bacterium]
MKQVFLKKIFFSILLLFCISSFEAAMAMDSQEPIASEPKPLSLGMLMYTDTAFQQESMEPLACYIGKAMNSEVQVRLFHNYFDILTEIDHDGLDLAILSPAIYALVMDDPALSFVAVPVRERLFYQSVILTAKDGPLTKISDLEGKKVGFVDPYSASGYLIPSDFLAKEGLLATGSHSYVPVFLGSHRKVARALSEKRIDAACVSDAFFDFKEYPLEEHKNFTIDSFNLLKLIPEKIPLDVIVCRSSFGKEAIAKLQETLNNYPKARENADSPLKKVIYKYFQTQPEDNYQTLRKSLDSMIGELNYKENIINETLQ